MAIKLGIVMDPITTVNTKKDSTYAMMLAADAKGWEIYYMEQKDLSLVQGEAYGSMQRIHLKQDPENWYALDNSVDSPLTQLDVLLMRKDPPVDSEFIYATYIAERAEQQGLLVVNKPQSLRDCNEKVFATAYPQCCPPVLISRNPKQLRAFVDEHQHVIFKPLDGMGGTSIFNVKAGDPNIGVILETLNNFGETQVMAQRYIPEISKGDKRILIIDGKPIDYALARIPSKGEHRGNLAAGGRGEAQPLTDRDRWIVSQIADDLKARGLLFVGIDVIGDYLTEINVTSPTCIQEINRAYDLDIAGDLMCVIEQKLNQ
ncbi:glutathione synthase [Oleiphilus sp. HI0009]|nr:glutathione synthase [Oleiphilus sp. HI0067]KZX73462.1 glutathione synthase [Oleiphilus sp. HI0009]KZY71661.1 glutathione synthase [Oleiphilus sp. HI0067]